MLKNIFRKKGKEVKTNENIQTVEPGKGIAKYGLNPDNIPRHIAIIMDGNGRWAKKRGQVRTFGHKAGAETLKTIVSAAGDMGVKVISAYAFSTENWKRPETEVSFIMRLLDYHLTEQLQEFIENNVQVRFMGDDRDLPASIRKKMQEVAEATKDNDGIILNLAINYGGQAEILRATKMIAAAVKEGRFDVEDIDEKLFEDNLYTRGLPAPDLLIRPGGDLRISNFLLWQIAYAEIWTTEVFWPDFTPEMLAEAIKVFQGRERRFGGLKKS